MPTVKEYLTRLALIELANRAVDNNLYFDYNRSNVVFVMTQDNDYRPLERYRRWIGGEMHPTIASTASKGVSIASLERGDYMWMVKGREAYLLCKDLLPHLAKTNKFYYCQELMMWYMSHESH
jgi:hypothetical protein